jgi:hypothetical protein
MRPGNDVHVVLIDCRASLPEIIIAFCDNAKCWFATWAPFTAAAPSLKDSPVNGTSALVFRLMSDS